MTLFCYFQIKPQEKIKFTLEERNELMRLSPDLNLVEADNWSDSFMLQQISKWIAEAKATYILFDIEEQVKIGGLSKVLESLRNKKPIQIFIKGHHTSLEKMLKMINAPTQKVEDGSDWLIRLSKEFRS